MSNISSDFPTRQPAPKIGENGTWLEWDEQTGDYVDTGVSAGDDKYNELQQTVQDLAARIDDLDVADEEEY